jgi:hypothetical protein
MLLLQFKDDFAFSFTTPEDETVPQMSMEIPKICTAYGVWAQYIL